MVTIVYSTRRDSTEKIAKEIAAGLGKASVCNLSQELPKRLDNFVVVGSPIYYEKPLPEVIEFLKKNDYLSGKRVAVFIVCLAPAVGKLGRKLITCYFAMMKKNIKGEIVSERVFMGWLLRENERALKEARLWGEELRRILFTDPVRENGRCEEDFGKC